jgi:hypothetical protein
MKFVGSGTDRWVMRFSAKLAHLSGAGTLYRTAVRHCFGSQFTATAKQIAVCLPLISRTAQLKVRLRFYELLSSVIFYN